jgi:glycosyltransferase involved in cell wall biosynthesis
MNNKFKIVMPSYNNADWVEINLESILEQTYDNYDVLYIDDCSTDNTNELVTKMVGSDPKFTIKRNPENQRRGYNIAPQNIGDFFDDDKEILIFVDGDDWLPYPNTLERLNNFYNKHDCWMTYGGMVCWEGGEEVNEANPQNSPYSDDVHFNKKYRKDMWRASHLRTFRWFLYNKIDDMDLRYSKTNEYYFHAEDLASSYPCLEMCPKSKIGVLDFISYVFNAYPSNRERGVKRENRAGIELEAEIRNKEVYDRLILPVTVKDLFRPNRFDLPMKYLYAKFRENNIKSNFGLEIYKEHLRLWNGFKEYNRPEKNTFEAFQDEFDNILDSIKNDGFDGNKSKIVIDSDNRLLNGAHRTIGCILYNKKAEFFIGEKYKDGQLDCGYKMFEDMGLDGVYLDTSALQLCRMNKNLFVVTLFPSAVGHDDEVETVLSKNGTIAYKKNVNLNANGAFNLMRQMYYGEQWAGGWDNNFAGFRDKAGLCFTDEGPVRVYLVEFDNVVLAQSVKIQIRDIYNISNHSVHINDTYEETMRLARVLLNDNSIHFMNNSNLVLYKNFQEQLNYFKHWIRANNLDIEDYCVTASSILSMYGLREGNDLDYLHNSLEIQGHDMIHSHNEYGIDRYHTHKDDIIYNPINHFYYSDIKFASLNVVKQLKQKRGESKDTRDLALMDRII